MRNLLPLLLLVLGIAFVGYLSIMLRTGHELRASERVACQCVEQVMRAQEAWHSRDEREGGVLYASFAELVDSGLVAGFEPVPSLGRTSRSEVYKNGDYYFELLLRPGSTVAGAVPVMGARYELWAWPSVDERVTSVLFWGSNAGYLLQGENGQVAGESSPPVGVHPLREAQRAVERAKASANVRARWVVLTDIRGEGELLAAE